MEMKKLVYLILGILTFTFTACNKQSKETKDMANISMDYEKEVVDSYGTEDISSKVDTSKEDVSIDDVPKMDTSKVGTSKVDTSKVEISNKGTSEVATGEADVDLTMQEIGSVDNHSVSAFTYNMDELTIVDTTKQLYTYKEMVTDLLEMEAAYKDKIRLQTIATTKDGRDVYEVIFGNPKAKKQLIIHASIHAREYMTTLLVMKQLEYYLHYYTSGSYQGIPYQELFGELGIHVLPMVSPDGVAISQSGLIGIQSEAIKTDVTTWYNRDKKSGVTMASFEKYLERFKANANGVDLNRNFNYGWEEFEGASKPGAEKYKGMTVESEPEADALVKLTKEIKPVAAISYHATGSVIYWDYGQTGNLREQCKTLVDTIHEVTNYEIKYAANDKQDAAGYGDWAVMVEHIPSATIEIGTGEAPLSIREFPTIWEENREMWAALAFLYK